jgi:hypothetical protein
MQFERPSLLIVGLLVVLVLQPVLNANSSQTILLGVIAGLLAILVLEPANRSLEYKVVPTETFSQTLLDQLGREGWQLISPEIMNANYVFRR